MGATSQGGWTLYTGIAGWMYCILIKEMFGLKVRGRSRAIDAFLPSTFETFSLHWARGQAVWEITVDKRQRMTRGVAWIKMDGRRLDWEELIQLENGPIKYKTLIHMGDGEAPS